MINSFSGRYRFLSNFHPCLIQFEEVLCNSIEHAFQAAKAIQPFEAAWIISAQTPSEAKRRGRKVKKRADWEEVRIEIMRGLLRFKFGHQDLLQQLLATGEEELIEGNWWHDTFWGCCDCPICKGSGENHLGKLLMEIRQECRAALTSFQEQEPLQL